MSYATIDLTNLPSPDVLETLDYEAILAELLEDLQARDESFTALVESDPAYIVLEVAAYREVVLRQRVNDAVKAVMLAFSTGNDLDNLAAPFGVSRNEIDPGDADAVPPVDPTYETDDSLRTRTPLAIDGQSTAGPIGAYVFHALSVAGVKDVAPTSPNPCEVVVTVLGLDGQGVPDSDILSAVESALSDDDIRPLTDEVTVQAATIIPYQISANLTLDSGPDTEVVLTAARTAVETFVSKSHKLGHNINLSAIYAALHQTGVSAVELVSPAESILVSDAEAAYCTAISLAEAG